jgi:hypothetical protein
MQVLAKPISVVAWFEESGFPHPVRFRIKAEDESEKVIKVDRVVTIDKEKIAGNDMLLFRCQSTIKNIQRLYEIKYELRTCKWILFKM